MKTWFRRHPNVAVVLIAAALVFSAINAALHVAAHNWPRLALSTIALIVQGYWLSVWWERT